ncbi:hypothetical protein BaRGS_00037989, partial [Batillaria attramentaria]
VHGKTIPCVTGDQSAPAHDSDRPCRKWAHLPKLTSCPEQVRKKRKFTKQVLAVAACSSAALDGYVKMPVQIVTRQLVQRGHCVASFLNQLSPTVCQLRARKSVFRVSQISRFSVVSRRTAVSPTEGQLYNVVLRNICYTSCATAKKLASKVETAPAFAPEDVCQVFDQTEKLIGQMKVREAEDLARKENLRLVSMGQNPDGVNSFRLMSGRELIEEAKRQRLQKKSEKVKEKEFRMKSNITDHDLEIKLRHAKEVLTRGDHVKVVIRVHKRAAEGDSDRLLTQLMKKVTSYVQDVAQVKQGVRNLKELQLLLRPIGVSGESEK